MNQQHVLATRKLAPGTKEYAPGTKELDSGTFVFNKPPNFHFYKVASLKNFL